MEATRFRVTRARTSEYPEPITFAKGAPLAGGERQAGPEGWNDWLFCETPGQKGGWVPAQVIEITGDGAARAREDYTARELDVRIDEVVLGTRSLNGWICCERADGSESGWVPVANLDKAGA